MAETTFTFRVDDDLKYAFTQVAEDGERSAAQLLRLVMRQAVDEAHASDDHDAWFRDAVGVGLAEADDPSVQLVEDGEVAARWSARRDELRRHAEGRTG